MENAPTVTGPVEGGRRGIAFCRPRTDVVARGYIVEEFIVDGVAVAYLPAPTATHGRDGRWDAVTSEPAPYRTRILVVRPERAEDFDGTVVCNWQNVTAGYELGSADDAGVLDGAAWVGVSAQAVGIHGFPGNRNALGEEPVVQWHLTAWEPERYGTLKHPGDDWSYDIFSQAAAIVGPRRTVGAVDPMGGLAVRRVIAAGASQSGGRLTTYYNAIHPLAGVFDGFLPSISGGFATSLHSKTAAAAAGEGGPAAMGRTGVRFRDDLPTPLFLVNSECESRGYHANRRADDDTFRFWEVAGTPHDSRMAPGKAEGGEGRILNPLSYMPFQAMALQHLVRWIDDGTTPPVFAGMDKILSDDGRAHLVRDEFGNVTGDLRHPALEAPTAEYHGANSQAPGFGRLFGWALPHDDAAVRARFGSETDYLERYAEAVDELIARAAVRAIDRDLLIAAVPPYPSG
ncbi:MAG TPA: alpha/beta hydrolase domain-containing protein [Acidimicrobiales bacterium]|nr:alpha/beta hydrolase domain-containing protein [Acidimicrobiales bacterium]